MVDPGVVKEAAAFVGAVLMAWPWVRDFCERMRLQEVKDIRARGGAERVKNFLAHTSETWLARAKISDLLCMIAGLVLVAIAFALGFLIEVGFLSS